MEQSIFISTFGDYPLVRVLDFLIYSRDFDYPITEIAENSKVNFQTLKKIWPRLEKNDFIIKTRKIGNAQLYKINENNAIIARLIDLNRFICLNGSEKAAQNKKKILVKA